MYSHKKWTYSKTWAIDKTSEKWMILNIYCFWEKRPPKTYLVVKCCVVNRNLETPHRVRSFSLTYLVCYYEFTCKFFLCILANSERIIFQDSTWAEMFIMYYANSLISEKFWSRISALLRHKNFSQDWIFSCSQPLGLV